MCDVSTQPIVVLAHHEQDLAVRLQPEDAVADVDAGLFQLSREADVRGLVEARFELDHDGDLLAVARGIDQITR